MNRSLATLERQLDGEIAIRRDQAGELRGQPGIQSARTGLAADNGPSAPREVSRIRVEDFRRIDDYLRAYLEDERFRCTHPLACGRWLVAWEMLWCADTRAKVIAVAARADEAMRAFAPTLVERCGPQSMDPRWPELLAEAPARSDPLDALASTAEAFSGQLGAQRTEVLRALVEHWRALIQDLRRHEDASQRPAERLRWEDGRRLVLFTALAMVEFDRSFA